MWILRLKIDCQSPVRNQSALIFIHLFLLSFLRLFATTYYVAPNGNNGNPGTVIQPWKTVGKACQMMDAGDTVFVRGGTYAERIIPQNSGNMSNEIVYIGYPGEEVTIDGTTITLPLDWGGLFDISDLHHIVVSGFRVINAGPHDNSVGILLDNSSDVILKDNITCNTTSSGIGVWECENITIDNNEVELACNDGEQECITISMTSGFEVKNNVVHDGGPGTRGGEGIDVKEGSSYGRVFRNSVYHINRLGIYVDAWDRYTHDIEVCQNLVHHCADDGFVLASEAGGLLENIRIINNIAHNNGSVGITIAGWGEPVASRPMKSLFVINNTCYHNGDQSWGGGISVENEDVDGLIIRNNIFSQNSLFQISIEVNVTDLSVDHNLIDGFRAYDDEIRGNAVVEDDPLFMDVTGADFHLQEDSPAIDQGSFEEAPGDDFDSYPRPQGSGIDIGAFEYRGSESTHLYTVMNTHDTGDGSLRQALLDCNNHIGPDTIQFDIPGDDDGFNNIVWNIKPLTNLPAVTDNKTYIDGSSQTANHGETNPSGPEVMLEGTLLGEFGNGLILNSSENVICGLIISGFAGYGIFISGSDACHNHVSNCYIGSNETGTDSVANGTGISLSNGARANVIGSIEEGKYNVISGNRVYGVYTLNSDSNRIRGNLIGTTVSGTEPLSNDFGIYIDKESEYNVIGGYLPGERNVISGNSAQGLTITGTSYNTITGNFIGLDETGLAGIGNDIGLMISSNATHNYIGGSNEGEGNIISGNFTYGLRIFGADNNEVIGNVIGLTFDGLDTLGNAYGILIDNNSDYNIIGGYGSVTRNIISGNRFFGLYISGLSDNNQVVGNFIGLGPEGDSGIGNGSTGIYLTTGSRFNRIGPNNIVSSNREHGIVIHGVGSDSNQVIGNWVGLDITGVQVLPNYHHGIRIEKGARLNIIGGSSLEDRNVVSGNGWSGIGTVDDSTGYNLFQNNYCGTDSGGVLALGNQYHGAHISGISNVLIGNLFSGNHQHGIVVSNYSKNNIFMDNRIGIQSDGINPLPNQRSGIRIQNQALANVVGAGNTIWYNSWFGIELEDSTVTKTTLTANSITANDSGGIILRNGANNDILQPVITGQGPLTGTASPFSLIEIFSDSVNQGAIYQDSTRADVSGIWTWDATLVGPRVTVTTTDLEGNTSEFSESVIVTQIENNINLGSNRFYLCQNYPNPFNFETTIRFGVKEPCTVNLKIFDIRGQHVLTLVNKKYKPGEYQIQLNASSLVSGIYLCQIQMGKLLVVKKMVLVK